MRAASERGLAVGEPQRFLALAGRGVDALVDGRALWAGGPRLGAERLARQALEAIAALEAGGRTSSRSASGTGCSRCSAWPTPCDRTRSTPSHELGDDGRRVRSHGVGQAEDRE